jgi:hypothetical protein
MSLYDGTLLYLSLKMGFMGQNTLFRLSHSFITTFNVLQTTKTNLKCIQISSPYRAVNTLRLCYKNQSVNAV